ncbi:probable protein phosphatase 2C 74 [Phoenix dactylifera]|uniref:protein-serine/threonine phosphatase n=1 Tax=Phoenix dactylifera TaxID=42345 RepID=A0A8B7CUS5_PHODC|nr:probable protein phosphatase 2C 74 [Phoenix dactylifera]
MADEVDLLRPLVSTLVDFIQVPRKNVFVALSSSSPSYPPLSWERFFVEPPALPPSKKPRDEASLYTSEGYERENSKLWRQGSISRGEGFQVENLGSYYAVTPPSSLQDGDAKVAIFMNEECKRGLESLSISMVDETKMSRKVRKRPARIIIPESCVSMCFGEVGKGKDLVEKEIEVEGAEYCLASRKGSRSVMEDGYGAITNINGDSKQAFFGVFDGHGGRAAVDFVTEKLGNNILAALSQLKEKENQLELAIRAGYLTTDSQLLSQGVSSGACVATVLLKGGELHVANAGDCRIVMSRKGAANVLTRDHRPGREDERVRIESSGGYVSCHNGVWRVQDSLAISRAIGDISMKEWIISEPEIKRLHLMSDCEFLIIASDGLWDKVTNQEAVDVVMRHKNSIKSCKDLVDISSSRGCRDDITVMVVDLQRFL